MLNGVRKAVCLATFFAAAAAASLGQGGAGTNGKAQAPAASTQQAAPTPPAAAASGGIKSAILDPGHGGTDEGAHGGGGIVEKDICLALAKAVGARLMQDGLQVVMTRQEDETVSFDQRAAIANAHGNAVFVSLHVGSAGAVGTARAYYYDFGELAELPGATAAVGGLVPWEEAQAGSAGMSQRLAQLAQAELSERLPGSAETPQGAAVYELRTIAAPAIAVELASVNAASESDLEAKAGPLAEAIARAIEAFRAAYRAEGR